MYTATIPSVIKPLLNDFLCRVNTPNKEVYLTFDDGPHPSVTNEVIDILKEYQAHGTFFCIGNNVANHPEVIHALNNAGHALGNHTYHHLNGWKTSTFSYLKNTLACHNVLPSTLFRPPYGRITRTQAKALKRRFTLVLWDVLSGDFDRKKSAEQCANTVITHTKPGSIIVFHDSEKAASRMIPALIQSLRSLHNQGYQFKPLSLPHELPVKA